jgi:hypothetical protein
MEVYDVEVLGVTPDKGVADLLTAEQTRAVQGAVMLASSERNLVITRRRSEIDAEMIELATAATLRKEDADRKRQEAESKTTMQRIEAEAQETLKQLETAVEEAAKRSIIAAGELTDEKARGDYELTLETKRTKLFEDKMKSITPDLVAALTALGDKEMIGKLSVALAPLALNEQTGLGAVIDRVFEGTPLAPVLKNMQGGRKKREVVEA